MSVHVSLDAFWSHQYVKVPCADGLIVVFVMRVFRQNHALKWIGSFWVIEPVTLLPGQFDTWTSWCAANNFFVSCVFSPWWTQQQLLSVVGLFTPPIHYFFFEPVHSAFCSGGGSYCLTTTISQWKPASHSSCRVQVNSPHEGKKIWTLTRANGYFSSQQWLRWEAGI